MSETKIIDRESLISEYADKMKQIASADLRDCEEDHFDADALLCDLLTALGGKSVVDAYKEICKWYA